MTTARGHHRKPGSSKASTCPHRRGITRCLDSLGQWPDHQAQAAHGAQGSTQPSAATGSAAAEGQRGGAGLCTLRGYQAVSGGL